jgi:hypothetical protein
MLIVYLVNFFPMLPILSVIFFLILVRPLLCVLPTLFARYPTSQSVPCLVAVCVTYFACSVPNFPVRPLSGCCVCYLLCLLSTQLPSSSAVWLLCVLPTLLAQYPTSQFVRCLVAQYPTSQSVRSVCWPVAVPAGACRRHKPWLWRTQATESQWSKD